MIGNRFITAKIYSIAISTAIVCMAAILTSCGGMSKQEKAMVGKYYIPAISDTRPLIELNADNRSVIRAIRPGEISFFVEGEWLRQRLFPGVDHNTLDTSLEHGPRRRA